jgi:hypothetical protein
VQQHPHARATLGGRVFRHSPTLARLDFRGAV